KGAGVRGHGQGLRLYARRGGLARATDRGTAWASAGTRQAGPARFVRARARACDERHAARFRGDQHHTAALSAAAQEARRPAGRANRLLSDAALAQTSPLCGRLAWTFCTGL